MSRVRGLLVSLAVLGGFWGLLLVVALLAGVVPGVGGGSAEPPDAGAPEVGPRGLEGSGDGGRPSERARGDQGETPEEDEAGEGPEPGEDGSRADSAEADLAAAEPAPDGELAPVSEQDVCDDAAGEPRALAVGDLVGDARPEIVVGCARRYLVLTALGDTMTVARVATYEIDPGAHREDATTRSDAAAVGDVNGDGRSDLLLPYWHQSPRGGSRGGGAFACLVDARGELGRPRRFVTEAVRQVVLADLDEDRGGLDVAVATRGTPWGEHSPEGDVRVFAGAGRPAERARLDAAVSTNGVAVAELDGDGLPDLVVTGGTTHVYLSDRPFSYEESRRLDMPSRRAIAGDLDGDGMDDVLVAVRTSVRMVSGGAPESFVDLPLGPLTPLDVRDVDGDGRNDVLAIRAGRVGVARQTDALVFDFRRIHPSAAGDAVDARLAHLDDDERVDLVLVTGSRGHRALVLVPAALHREPGVPLEERSIDDAPGASDHGFR